MPDWVFWMEDHDAMIPSPFIDRLLILVAGGTSEKSTLIPGWYDAGIVSKEICLPSHWDELIQKKAP